ncbi:MAG: aminoglycoside 6-adenylyltransferase [Chloroflexota bacterium]
MSPSEVYIRQRQEFLQKVKSFLSTDERFVAAWLTGSFAKGEQDTLSDVDLTLVVSDGYAQTLCSRPWQVSAQTTPERYGLFCLFGEPATLHENHHNAPEGGTFTFVLYAQSAIMVDWVLRPLAGARRPSSSLLLFDSVGIPLEPPLEPESLEQRARQASEVVAFFWMMAAVTVKHIARGDAVFVNRWLEELAGLIQEVHRLIQGQPWSYLRGPSNTLAVTPDEQIRSLHQLCEQMMMLMPTVKQLGGYVAESPMLTVERLIGIAQEKLGSSGFSVKSSRIWGL